MASTKIVVTLIGGVLESVFCSDSDAQCVLIDWDAREADGAIEVDGSYAFVSDVSVADLNDIRGTDCYEALDRSNLAKELGLKEEA